MGEGGRGKSPECMELSLSFMDCDELDTNVLLGEMVYGGCICKLASLRQTDESSFCVCAQLPDAPQRALQRSLQAP